MPRYSLGVLWLRVPQIQFGVVFQRFHGALLLGRRCQVGWNFLSPPPHLIKISTGRRGEVKLLMVNTGANPHHILTANPLAQVSILPYMAAIFQEVPRLSETIRGTMTFERPQPHFVSSAPHVVSSAPSGPQSPLMSQHSLFGELFPRYIWLWTTYIILYLSIKYFFVSFFVILYFSLFSSSLLIPS